MTSYDVGDYAVLTLDVPEGTGATSAAVTGWTRPDGTTPATLPSATPSDSGRHWEAVAPLDAAGEWTAVWTVTGPGQSVESYTVQVAPIPPATGRAYATTGDLASWLEGAPPPGSRRLLARATELVDDRLTSAVYDVTGPDELPTAPDVAGALRDAVCAQVEAWQAAGTDHNGAGRAAWSQVTAGRITLVRAAGQPAPPSGGQLAPAAIACLRRVGLLRQPVGY